MHILATFNTFKGLEHHFEMQYCQYHMGTLYLWWGTLYGRVQQTVLRSCAVIC